LQINDLKNGSGTNCRATLAISSSSVLTIADIDLIGDCCNAPGQQRQPEKDEYFGMP
jgi:hypothetical protein